VGTRTHIIGKEDEMRERKKGGDGLTWGSGGRWIEITGVGDGDKSSDLPLVVVEWWRWSVDAVGVGRRARPTE
jgi:hypothetical protein